MTTFFIVGAILLVLLFLLIMIYNRMTKLRILVKEAWSGIATFLQQRADLIPNLVETVKGYAVHESKTLTDVIKWRNRSVAAGNAGESIEAANGLNRALMDFFVLSEQYPDLKANSNFMSLQNDLKELETKINQSRRYYNGTVRNYNQAIAVIPNNLVAGPFGFTAEPFFEAAEGAEAVPKISFQ